MLITVGGKIKIKLLCITSHGGGVGLHQEINYHFMEPGHTKCICDGCFGKIRQLFRRSDVDTPQLSSRIERSARINSSVIYRDSYQEGQISSGMDGTATLIQFSRLCWAFSNRELKHQTFLRSRTSTGSHWSNYVRTAHVMTFATPERHSSG